MPDKDRVVLGVRPDRNHGDSSFEVYDVHTGRPLGNITGQSVDASGDDIARLELVVHLSNIEGQVTTKVPDGVPEQATETFP